MPHGETSVPPSGIPVPGLSAAAASRAWLILGKERSAMPVLTATAVVLLEAGRAAPPRLLPLREPSTDVHGTAATTASVASPVEKDDVGIEGGGAAAEADSAAAVVGASGDSMLLDSPVDASSEGSIAILRVEKGRRMRKGGEDTS